MQELIQNSDDNIYEDDVTPTLKMELYPHAVVVFNNEMGFKEDNIVAVCNVGGSTKSGRSGYIGNLISYILKKVEHQDFVKKKKKVMIKFTLSLSFYFSPRLLAQFVHCVPRIICRPHPLGQKGIGYLNLSIFILNFILI